MRPEPLRHDALVKAGEYCLEQDNGLVSDGNPQGIGEYFGSAAKDNLNTKKTEILWCDDEVEAINTVNVCKCVEPGKRAMGKDPHTGRKIRMTPVEYTTDGVIVWVEYEKKAKARFHNKPKAKKSQQTQKQLKKTPIYTRRSPRKTGSSPKPGL